MAILRNQSHSDSEAIRIALHEAAQRRRRTSALRAEVEELVRQPGYREETRRVLAEMEEYRAPWPED